MKDVVEAAIKYVDHDISIVPIRFRLKRLDFKLLRSTMPALGTMLPYLNKVPTKKEIVTWFGNKDSNLGIVTGYKDTFCIDFDDERSFEDWKERFPFVFSHTPVQKTFRGYHVFLKLKDRIHTSKALFEGNVIGDIKGYRSYTVAFPSIHPSGIMYKWLEGHAPWEKEIMYIESLEEIGIVSIQRKTLYSVICLWGEAMVTESPSKVLFLLTELIRDHWNRL